MSLPPARSFLSDDYIVSKVYATGNIVLLPKEEPHLATLIFLTDQVGEHFGLFAKQNMVPLSTKVLLVQPSSLKASQPISSRRRGGLAGLDAGMNRDAWFEAL